MTLPSGTFDGTIHGYLKPLGKLWTGKTFTGDTVINHIAGRKLIEGDVRREGDEVIIHYPRLGLTDRLTDLFGDGSRWAGVMELGRWTIRFTLTRPRERR